MVVGCFLILLMLVMAISAVGEHIFWILPLSLVLTPIIDVLYFRFAMRPTAHRLNVLYGKLKPVSEADKITVLPLQGGSEPFEFSESKLFKNRAKIASMLSVFEKSRYTSNPDREAIPWFKLNRAFDVDYNYGFIWTKDIEAVDLLLAMGRALKYVRVCDDGILEGVDCPYILIDDTYAKLNERYLRKDDQIRSVLLWHFRMAPSPTSETV